MCDPLEPYANDKYIDGDVYKDYYPIDLRESMMDYAINNSNIHSSKKHEISEIFDNPNISMLDKFNRFIDLLNKEDLYYIGW